MKTLTIKKLFAITILSISLFSLSVSAQPNTANSNDKRSDLQIQKQSLQAQSTNIICHCTLGGGFTGCWLNRSCALYCRWYCRHHLQIENVQSNSTTLAFYNEKSGHVSLKIFDSTGRLIKTLTDNIFEEGEYSLVFNNKDENGNALVPGIYSLRMTEGENSEIEKLIVMK